MKTITGKRTKAMVKLCSAALERYDIEDWINVMSTVHDDNCKFSDDSFIELIFKFVFDQYDEKEIVEQLHEHLIDSIVLSPQTIDEKDKLRHFLRGEICKTETEFNRLYWPLLF